MLLAHGVPGGNYGLRYGPVCQAHGLESCELACMYFSKGKVSLHLGQPLTVVHYAKQAWHGSTDHDSPTCQAAGSNTALKIEVSCAKRQAARVARWVRVLRRVNEGCPLYAPRTL